MPASRRLPPRRGAGGTLDPACVRPLQPRTPEDSQLMWRVDTHGVYRSPAPKPDALASPATTSNRNSLGRHRT
jgi:hypothetical protein